jgi:hypothetical protein
MAENKTKPTKAGVAAFLNKIADKRLREDCFAILGMMREVSKCDPVLWGAAIIGFGTYHYMYDSGREGDSPLIAFSPRKQNLTLYLMGGHAPIEAELAALGKHKTGKACLYIKSLADVDAKVLRKIISISFKEAKRLQAK